MTQEHTDYGEDYYHSREAWPDFRREVETLLGLISLSPEARVLEVGCGGGELLRRLERLARRAVGVDLSPVGLRLAMRRPEDGGAPVVLCARAEALPFAGGAFDAVVAQHLVEHLPDPVEAFREWRRALKPGGVLALVTPNAAYPDPAHFSDPGHIRLFTAESLHSTLEAAGFRVVHLSTLFPYLGRGRLARAVSERIPSPGGRGRCLVAAGAG